jgi:hypothetical protein
MAIRNRIKEHRSVRAGDLVPHELNWRKHPASQRAALESIYKEVGFARSLLVYELPDGRLKVIDGHLRRDMNPDMRVNVEVLDVNEAEARKLLLSIDSLASLAETDRDVVNDLVAETPTDSPVLKELWGSLARRAAEAYAALPDAAANLPERFLILVECADEAEQVGLLERWQAEGISCRTLIS